MINQKSLLSFVGGTPLLRLRLPDDRRMAQVWCKLELMNPSGSCKDRMCLSIVEDLETRNLIRPGDCLVEASCGNTAISLAMICAAKGYSLVLAMPENCPPERIRLFQTYGAETVLTPASEGMKGAVNRLGAVLDSLERAFEIGQFENPANPEIHRRTTAAEIMNDLGRAPDVFVAGVGTGGTLTGVGEAFKAANGSTRVVAVEPAESPVLSGGNPGPHSIPGIGAGFIPKILNTDIIDDVAVVTYEEAMAAVTMLARSEGIHSGPSSGANLHVAFRQAERLGPEKIVATVLCDSGERYSSSPV